ncbi:hypothetical protein [Vibrio ostreicida]|uniref:hypothetical protein n=1 Tax=Vibrio ostreicida TaxID=526588 RepID=UPI0015C39B76|nr:hypothetical protein [Vibrio ostreicida]
MIDAIAMFGYTSIASKVSRLIGYDKIIISLNKVFGFMFVGCGALLAVSKV